MLRDFIRNMQDRDWKFTRFLWMLTNTIGKQQPIICRGYVCVMPMEFISNVPLIMFSQLPAVFLINRKSELSARGEDN